MFYKRNWKNDFKMVVKKKKEEWKCSLEFLFYFWVILYLFFFFLVLLLKLEVGKIVEVEFIYKVCENFEFLK